MKLRTVVYRSFLVIRNKSAKICLNIFEDFEDSVIQSLKSGKTRKSGLVPMSRQEKLTNLFLVFLPDLKHNQRRFICIPSLNVPEMRPLGTFQSILSNGHHGNNDHYKNFEFSFGYVLPISITVQSFITIKWQENKL